MANFVVGGLVVLLFGGAVRYIYKQRKSGAKCIGCPNSGSCSSGCHCK